MARRLALDAVAILTAYGLALGIGFHGWPPAVTLLALRWALPVAFAAGCMLTWLGGLYEGRAVRIVGPVALAALTTAAMLGLSFGVAAFGTPRSVIALAAAFSVPLLYALRSLQPEAR